MPEVRRKGIYPRNSRSVHGYVLSSLRRHREGLIMADIRTETEKRLLEIITDRDKTISRLMEEAKTLIKVADEALLDLKERRRAEGVNNG